MPWIRLPANKPCGKNFSPCFERMRLDLHFVRKFYNQGLMLSLVPELSAIHGLVQHDAFHLYPVQEHHFRTLAELKKIFRGDYAQAEPELTQMAQDVEDPTMLYLAGLVHDMGKSSGRGHAAHGGAMIPAVARRLGLNAEESEFTPVPGGSAPAAHGQRLDEGSGR